MTLTTLQMFKPFGTLTYRATGQSMNGKATPLVLIHGVGMQSAAWGPQITEFSKTRPVIALDMPGHGGSDPIKNEASLPDYLAWLQAVLNHLKLDRINLAGHSMGALMAGGYAVCHPEKLERVALLNAVFCRSPAARKAVINRAEQISNGAFDLETPLDRWFGNTICEQMTRNKVAKWLSDVKIKSYATAYTAFAHGDATYADGFAKISCPLLTLTGDEDLNSTPAMSQAMASAAPKGHAVIIKGHRHMVNLTAPEAVNAALKKWLQTPIKDMNAT